MTLAKQVAMSSPAVLTPLQVIVSPSFILLEGKRDNEGKRKKDRDREGGNSLTLAKQVTMSSPGVYILHKNNIFPPPPKLKLIYFPPQFIDISNDFLSLVVKI